VTITQRCRRFDNPSEHWEQAKFIEWWRKNHEALIFAIPNGGRRGGAQAARLQLEGVLPGVWDLFVPEQGLWIEFKRRHTGTLSKEQRDFGRRMLEAGYRCMVAYGCDDAIEQVKNGERSSWPRKVHLDHGSYAPWRHEYRPPPEPHYPRSRDHRFVSAS